MRDSKCNGEYLEKIIDFYEKTIIEKEKKIKELEDIFFDFMVKACNLKRTTISRSFQKLQPYRYIEEIVDLSSQNKEKAALKAEEYMNSKWLKGYSDYGWVKAHERGLCGNLEL